jgi:anti-sigma regulatory factor (Ser/Thr protein kinase)
MIDSMPTAGVSHAERFERIGVAADPLTAAHTRDEFASWVRDVFDLDENRSADLVLAIYEALANTAEYAYPTMGRTGTMDVVASYDPLESALLVTVADRGQWRTASSVPGDRSRGRGIALMKALTDRVSIQTSTRGTTVRLAWTGVHPR